MRTDRVWFSVFSLSKHCQNGASISSLFVPKQGIFTLTGNAYTLIYKKNVETKTGICFTIFFSWRWLLLSSELMPVLNGVPKSKISVLNRVRIWAPQPHLPARTSFECPPPPQPHQYHIPFLNFERVINKFDYTTSWSVLFVQSKHTILKPRETYITVFLFREVLTPNCFSKWEITRGQYGFIYVNI